MKRTATALLALLLIVVCVAPAQTYKWQHMGVFPPAGLAPKDTIFGGDVHGIAVDKVGRIWIQLYGVLAKDSILIPNYCSDKDTSVVDSLIARWTAVRALHVYNPNGTEASFSPIFYANIGGGKIDTLGGESWYVKGMKVWHPSLSVNTGRGLRADAEGNIFASYFGYIYKFDGTTGACTGKLVADAAASIVAAGVDLDGDVFSTRVVAGGQPLKIFDKNNNFLGNVTDTLIGFSRTLDVSGDANDVYFAGYTNNAIYQYHSDNGILGPYAVPDTILKGFACEAMAWNRKTGHLWMADGSALTPPNKWPGLVTNYDSVAWYGYNTTTKTLTGERIKWVFYGTELLPDERPRGIAFSPGGDSAYVCIFGKNLPVPGVRWYKRTLVSVDIINEEIPSGYTLTQNYPNPFNPSTEIEFTVPKAGMTTIKVFDVLGKEVATLVNDNLNPGTFKTRLDGSKLSSGTYIYTLTSGSTHISKKMMLVK